MKLVLYRSSCMACQLLEIGIELEKEYKEFLKTNEGKK